MWCQKMERRKRTTLPFPSALLDALPPKVFGETTEDRLVRSLLLCHI